MVWNPSVTLTQGKANIILENKLQVLRFCAGSSSPSGKQSLKMQEE